MAGARETSPARRVSDETPIEVVPARRYASRGGEKLEAALDAFGVDPAGRIALDAGASTGGFVDCLLQRGAKKVYAVDVGRGLLDRRLANDPRVVVLDRTNLRHLTPDVLARAGAVRSLRRGDARVELVTLDLSFISLTKVEGAVSSVLVEGGEVVALVKPQFEAGRSAVGKGGIVRDAVARAEAVARVADFYRRAGYDVMGFMPSPVAGRKGNREAFLRLVRRADGSPGELRAVIAPYE